MISMREKQKAEAAFWLELTGVREDVRRKFEEGDTVMLCSDGQYHPVDDSMGAEIRRFEQEHNATVYLAVRVFTALGDLDAMLFVGKYEEEWPLEREDIKAGYAMSYTINRDYPDCSEMGSIFFRTTEDGGIIREV